MQCHPFRYQTLSAATTFIACVGYAVEDGAFRGLAILWAFYVLIFCTVAVARENVRGLTWPAVVIVAMAIFHGAQLAPLLVLTAMCCSISYAAVAALKLLACWIAGIFTRWRKARREQTPQLGPVTVAVTAANDNIDATEILDRLGLGDGRAA